MLDRTRRLHQTLFEAGLTFRCVHGLGIALTPPQHFDQRQGRIFEQPCPSRRGRCSRMRSSGSMPSDKQTKENTSSGLQARQARVQSSDRLRPRPARSPSKHRGWAQARRAIAGQADLFLRQRRSQRRHGVSESSFAQRDHIHITFADNQPAFIGATKRPRARPCSDTVPAICETAACRKN